jgi:glutathione peroxidase
MRLALAALTLAFAFVAITSAEEKQAAAPLSHTVKTIDGKEISLDKYKGKVLLIVNVASKCGYTKQYKGLEALHEQYADKGLAILGFPCNQFGGQEPGSDADVKAFCSSTYNVKFDMFSKIDVNGANTAPLYKDLKATADDKGEAGDVKWNFEKFLIGRDGKVIGRYRSAVTPEDLAKEIDKALAAK